MHDTFYIGFISLMSRVYILYLWDYIRQVFTNNSRCFVLRSFLFYLALYLGSHYSNTWSNQTQ